MIHVHAGLEHLHPVPERQVVSCQSQAHWNEALNIKLCSVVKAELLYGAARSHRPIETLRRLDAFFAAYESIPFDDAAAVQYGRIRGQLAGIGTPIGPSATALAHQLILVTHNTREFARVSGLSIEDWELP